MEISTRDLSGLPDVPELERICKSVAMLDAIICPDWEYRYFSFDSQWGWDGMLASMRNGCGDDYWILFSPRGAVIKGFYHESPVSPYGNDGKVWPGVLETVPKEFEEDLEEPSLCMEDTTFCIWKLEKADRWSTGHVAYTDKILKEYGDPDGSEYLLFMLDGSYNTYKEWAEEYYEKTLDLQVIKDIFAHRPLSDEMVKRLNPEISLADLKEDIRDIEYPSI